MALGVGTLLPSFEGATQWFNGEISAAELRGHSVLVHFWSVSCPACLHSMETLVVLLLLPPVGNLPGYEVKIVWHPALRLVY